MPGSGSDRWKNHPVRAKVSYSVLDRAQTFFRFYVLPRFSNLGATQIVLRVDRSPAVHPQNLLFKVVGKDVITFSTAI
jgi:hypothetical protein